MIRSWGFCSFTNILNRLIRFKRTSAAAKPTSSARTAPSDFADPALGKLKFIEEPLGVHAEQGYGYPRFEFGESIGPDHRFKLLRKLGFGRNSSTWLALDERCVPLSSAYQIL
jgi:hypothetical protein